MILVIDQGGHSSRVLVFTDGGRLVTGAAEAVREHRQGSRVELDADAIAASIHRLLHRVRRRLGARASAVRAAALATQRSTIVCWDRVTGAPLAPALSWQDLRAASFIRTLDRYATKVARLTGLRLSPHYGAGKMRWCLQHLPAVRAAARAGRLGIGPLSSFLTFRLTGGESMVVDPANAGRTLLFNPAHGDWEDALLGIFGIDRALLPHCVPTRYDFGTLRWGRARLPLALVSGDQSCALYGHGAPDVDTVYMNAGTGAFLQRPIAGCPPNRRGLLVSQVYADAQRRQWVIEATINGAASALDWAEARLRLRGTTSRLAGWMDRERAPPLFLNGVSGLGSQFWRARFRSRFVGAGSGPARMVAVAESIVFLARTNVAIMEALGGTVRQLVVSGGLAQADGLCQRLADLCGMPVWRPDETEATARGAAFLAAGQPGSWASPPGEEFRPGRNPALRRRYRRWRAGMARALAISG